MSENFGKVTWVECTLQAELSFRTLTRTFTESPILQHLDPAQPIILQKDTSGIPIAGILNQYNSFGALRKVNFQCGMCSSAAQNYDTYDLELLAIVEILKQWRHFLEGASHKVLFRCDHKNLDCFQTSKVFSRRQARWSETLTTSDFVIEQMEGSKNPSDGPSRQPDYMISYERPVA